MKYIVKIKGARIFRSNKQGVLSVTPTFIRQGTIVEGLFKKMSVVTPKGTAGVLFLEIPSLGVKGNMYIHVNAVVPYKSKAEGGYESFSGSEMVAKVGATNVLIPAGIFGGLGFLLGTLIGENKVQLTLSGAVLGGLIGYSSFGFEEKMGADGKRKISTPIIIPKTSPAAPVVGGIKNQPVYTMQYVCSERDHSTDKCTRCIRDNADGTQTVIIAGDNFEWKTNCANL
jgi:hypothetical protein